MSNTHLRGIKPPQEAIDEALALYREDRSQTVEQIAWRFGVNRKTVRGWAREAGIPPRSTARLRTYSAEDDALAVRLYRQTNPRLSMLEISAQTGMSPFKILDAAKAAGVPIRKPGRAGHGKRS